MSDVPSVSAEPPHAEPGPDRPQQIDGVFGAIGLIALANATAIGIALGAAGAPLVISGVFAGAVSGRICARQLNDARRWVRICGRGLSFVVAPALHGLAAAALMLIAAPSVASLVGFVPLGLIGGATMVASGVVNAPLSLAPWLLAWTMIEWSRRGRARAETREDDE